MTGEIRARMPVLILVNRGWTATAVLTDALRTVRGEKNHLHTFATEPSWLSRYSVGLRAGRSGF
jgi:hypothetical protein